MKVLAISGGTKNGSNDSICREALLAAQACGAETAFIRLLDLNLKYCTGCGACMKSLNMGQGGGCIQKDDFQWLRDQILDVDSVLFSMPVFEKGLPGVFHTVLDRFGPGNDWGTNKLGAEISEKVNGKFPDQRLFRQKTVAFLGTGGTDYTTMFQCTCSMLAMLMRWDVLECDVFQWTTCFPVEDERVQRVHRLGEALASPERRTGRTGGGVCPHCGCSNFYLYPDGRGECCLCGIKGRLISGGDGLQFVFPQEQLQHAADTESGKLCHAMDIRENQQRRGKIRQSEKFRKCQQRYQEVLPLKPEHEKA